MCFSLPKTQQADAFFTYCLAQGVVFASHKNFQGMQGEWFRIGIKDIATMTSLHNCLQTWFNLNKGEKSDNFYLVRHGETQWNQEHRLQGWLDSPLTENGRAAG